MASKMAFFLVRREIVREEKSDIYAFGLEILIASVVNGILAAAISLSLGIFWQSMLMLFPFLLIRSNGGGYHADSHTGCMLGFVFVYSSFLFAAKHLPPGTVLPLALCSLMIGTAVILAIGPLPHKNRPVSGRELKSFSVKTRILAVLLAIVGSVGLFFSPCLFIYFALGIVIAAGSLLAGCIQTKSEGGH
jgi:accessory gene regulator B